MAQDLLQKVKTLSTKPGVYQMLNANGTVIYVGKAKNLKKRVSQYFRKNLDSVKTQKLMSQVVDFKVTITDSENEALLLEWNLIKSLHPRYNVLLRDDKSYPYLFLSTTHDFPRLDFHRGAKRLKGRYFGPYPNAGAVRENLALIQKLFKLRQCSETFFRNRTRPCLQYQINRCTAPCVGYVTKAEYADQVNNALLFLEGKSSEVLKSLQLKMEHASEEKNYEAAAEYRDLLIRLRKLQTKQYVTGDQGDIDILDVAESAGQYCIAVIFIRGGHLIGHRTYFPNVPAGSDKTAVLAEFIPQYYLSPMRGDQKIERIVLGAQLPERLWLQSALQEALGFTLKITDRRLEHCRQWLRLARKNAEFALSQRLLEKDNAMGKLLALQHALNLPNPIARIECFDISHTMGEATVASCVVYGEEGPVKRDYRRFNIRDITPGDDYAAMHQAIHRRYTRVKSGEGVLPDLLIIDGGLGQLHHAEQALEDIQVSGVILLGVAKGVTRKPGMETLYLSGRDHPIHLDQTHLALHLIQYIRDEAHRFAIAAHRAARAKKRQQSPLEGIEGVGPKRRRELLRHFGGLQELKKAGVKDIRNVPGISEKVAQRIYDALHE